jgi:hypothetical protein
MTTDIDPLGIKLDLIVEDTRLDSRRRYMLTMTASRVAQGSWHHRPVSASGQALESSSRIWHPQPAAVP